MSPWAEFYKDRVGDSYTEYARERYAPFIEEVISWGQDFREEGCGIGTISKILLEDGVILLQMVDIDEDMLYLCRRNLNVSDVFLPSNSKFITFHKGDIIFGPGPEMGTDVIFSHGVLEHFTDEQIDSTLSRQLKTAQKVIHYVPTDGYTEPSFGDERLLSVDWWVKNWRPSRHEVFNSGKDLILVWEK